jgi:serine/threonine protein kinase
VDGAPEVVGRYRLVEPLGEGAAGVVCRAAAPDGTQVALKVVRDEVAREERGRKRLEHEVRAARELRHPNLPGGCLSRVRTGTG